MIDFSKGIDFSPLTNLGIAEETAKQLLLGLLPFASLEVQAKIKSGFSPAELTQLAKEALTKGINPEEGAVLLEEKYHAKTGRYFMEELRLALNDYVVHASRIIENARSDASKVTKNGEKKQQELEALLAKKDYRQAAELLEAILKEKDK